MDRRDFLAVASAHIYESGGRFMESTSVKGTFFVVIAYINWVPNRSFMA